MNKKRNEVKRFLDEEYQPNTSQKEKSWNAIQASLTRKKTKKRTFTTMISTAAACGVLALGLSTSPGLALLDNVKELFVKEKTVTLSMEGTEEPTDVTLHENKESHYVMYVDEAQYKMEKKEGYDVITTKTPLPATYPEVSMKIAYDDGDIEAIKQEIATKEGVTFEKTSDPLEGFVAKKTDGNEWDSVVHTIYVVPNEGQGAYIIDETYFLEASEGHGARFHQMLEEFYIVSE